MGRSGGGANKIKSCRFPSSGKWWRKGLKERAETVKKEKKKVASANKVDKIEKAK